MTSALFRFILPGRLPVFRCAFETAHLSTSAACFVKKFAEGENAYAHRIMERLGTYNLMDPHQSSIGIQKLSVLEAADLFCTDLSVPQLLESYERVALHCKSENIMISSDKLDKMVDALIQKLPACDDDQLLTVLRVLAIFPSTEGVNVRNFSELWNAIDRECVERMDVWSIDRLLLTCDHWSHLNMCKICRSAFQATKRLGRKLRRLTPSQLVQTMFYVNMQREPMVEMFDFETAMLASFDKLNIDEIAIMSMGFFKTKTRINNPDIVEHIYDRLFAATTTISDISLAAILKILRYSAKPKHADNVIRVQEQLMSQLDRLSLLSCLHIALLGTNFQCYHPGCLDVIIAKFIKEHKAARLKDIERIAFVMGLFDYNGAGNRDKLCQLILEDIPLRQKEIVKYIRCFPSLIHHLAICGHWDESMISTVLERKLYEAAYGKNVLKYRDILCLDSFTRINLRESYQGTRLADKMRQSCAKQLSSYIPAAGSKYKLSAADKSLLELKTTLDEMYASKFTTIEHMLPHFERPDVLMAFKRRTGTPVELCNINLPAKYSGIILSKDQLIGTDGDAEVDVVTFVIGGRNSYIRNTETKTGLLRMRIEQLHLIGHHVIEIPFYVWTPKTPNEQTAYLRNAISKVLM